MCLIVMHGFWGHRATSICYVQPQDQQTSILSRSSSPVSVCLFFCKYQVYGCVTSAKPSRTVAFLFILASYLFILLTYHQMGVSCIIFSNSRVAWNIKGFIIGWNCDIKCNILITFIYFVFLWENIKKRMASKMFAISSLCIFHLAEKEMWK